MIHYVKTAVLGSLLTGCSLLAIAQQGDVMKACNADMKSLCSGIEKGQGRIAQCLRQNEDKLSEGCKSRIREMQQSRSKGGRQNRRESDAMGGSN